MLNNSKIKLQEIWEVELDKYLLVKIFLKIQIILKEG